MKRQGKDQEKIFMKYICGDEFEFRVHKKIYNKKTNYTRKKLDTMYERLPHSKRYLDGQEVHEKYQHR